MSEATKLVVGTIVIATLLVIGITLGLALS